MAPSDFTQSARPPAAARTAVAHAHEIGVGFHLGRIEILGKLGSGGMGDVWLGRIRSHGEFVRLVAVKTVHAQLGRDKRARELFLREAAVSASIRHTNVVEVHDVGEFDGVLYQVMTLIEGLDLAAMLALTQAPLPVGVVVSVVGDALLGLHAAHEAVDDQGRPCVVAHRDISPQNIIVGLDGVARVSDFGIAKAFTATDEVSGSLRGKCAYFSPEQARQAPIDRRSDIFSMGIVLWEALTGTRLFRRETFVETLAAVLGGAVADPREIRPTIPAPIAAITMRALERQLASRYPTAETMANDLLQAARSSGCLLPRPDVAVVIEKLAGPAARERVAAAAAALPDDARRGPEVLRPVTSTTQKVMAAPSVVVDASASARHRKAKVTVTVTGALLLAALAGFVAARRAPGPSSETSADVAQSPPATPAPVATAEREPPDYPSGRPAVTASATATAPNPASATGAARTPKPSHRDPRLLPPRKAPFDDNPFGSLEREKAKSRPGLND